MGEHVEEVAGLGFNDALHLVELGAAEAFFDEPFQERGAGARLAQDAAQIILVVEKFGQLAEKRAFRLRSWTIYEIATKGSGRRKGNLENAMRRLPRFLRRTVEVISSS